MKTKRILLAIAAAFALSSAPLFAQTDTNAPPPIISSPVTDFLSRSNLIVAPYVIYDTTSHQAGGGIALAYKLTEFLVPTLRFDYINGSIWNPSASLQLQVPFVIAGKVRVTPFVFDGIATPMNGMGNNNFDPENIVGIGAAIDITDHIGIVGDWERWTGAGFNDNQIRAGAFWKF